MKKNHIWKHNGTMLIDKNDNRHDDFLKIQEETGISPDECWSLDYTISLFVLPRLKMFKKKTIGVPCCFKTMKEWKSELSKMIRAFEMIVKDKHDEQSLAAIEKGLDSFRKYFFNLWW